MPAPAVPPLRIVASEPGSPADVARAAAALEAALDDLVDALAARDARAWLAGTLDTGSPVGKDGSA